MIGMKTLVKQKHSHGRLIKKQNGPEVNPARQGNS
jgi:hypothetical protein